MQTAILGIDYGQKRVGVALATDGRAAALETIQTHKAFDRLKVLADHHKVAVIIVGLPRNLDGDDTHQTAAARDFAADLGKTLGLTVLMQDEAVTSELARERLVARGVNITKHKDMIDAEAAGNNSAGLSG